MQQNINLIRSNEVEADNLAIEIIKSSPFKTSAFSDFFSEMMNAMVMFREAYLTSQLIQCLNKGLQI